MKFTKMIKSKRGIALENAIMFTVMIFSLCFLLTSLAIIANTQTKIERKEMLQRIAVDQIGEDFLAGDFSSEGYSGYEYTADESTLTVWRENDDKKKTVLYIEKDTSGQVLVWRYSAPEADAQE